MDTFKTFASWDDLLAHLKAARNVWYQAPLDRLPAFVHVRKLFKNGKIRVWAGEVAFTADAGHLDRFRYRT